MGELPLLMLEVKKKSLYGHAPKANPFFVGLGRGSPGTSRGLVLHTVSLFKKGFRVRSKLYINIFSTFAGILCARISRPSPSQ